jgi:hypothetical protein
MISTLSWPCSRYRRVEVGDLQLAARAGLDALGDVDHLVVVEIQAGDGVVALGALGFSSMLTRLALASNSTTP